MGNKDKSQSVIKRKDLQALFDSLIKKGYSTYGPCVQDGAVVYDRIESVSELPIGWTDRQDNGNYRLTKTKEKRLFGFVVGPHTWKKYLYPSESKLWEAKRSGHEFEIVAEVNQPYKQAFIGVRPCELQALAIQDKAFLEGEFTDVSYLQRRQNVFIVAVNCVQPGGTCFCSSMKTGPKASGGFDLALTEVVEPNKHYFVVEAGSSAGVKILKEIPGKAAGEKEVLAAKKALRKASSKMGRRLDTDGLEKLLFKHIDHPHWNEISSRCLTCGNCTMVCPTCFCGNIEDVTDLTGQTAERRRKWDTCFSVDFSYIHGGSIRSGETARYRQWMMHKLAYWPEQFGTFGCVGCGRCITWCPVGIDITEEAGVFKREG
ncbi:MAG: 4Fe-4S dicluster domain-containing protein [Candidatus Zixiibacteriota bacterium]|nr:MAG: 4Fe-4S dicluster domain-containing protein [candidate division Zixibacteria bacterium]